MTGLPEVGALMEATCGCTGTVVYASRLHGGHVHLRVSVPCLRGHPWTVGAGVVEHMRADQVRAVLVVGQLAFDLQMETAAA